MPVGPPPPRYRVVERERRLEVIDTRTGAPVQAPLPRAVPGAPSGASRWPTLPEQEGFDGRALLTTHRWYDAKAPRQLLLDPGTVQRIGMIRGATIVVAMVLVLIAIDMPAILAVLLLPFALAHGSARRSMRTAATAWLDRFDPAAR